MASSSGWLRRSSQAARASSSWRLYSSMAAQPGEAGFPAVSGMGDFGAAAVFGGANECHQETKEVFFAAGESVPPSLGGGMAGFHHGRKLARGEGQLRGCT